MIYNGYILYDNDKLLIKGGNNTATVVYQQRFYVLVLHSQTDVTTRLLPLFYSCYSCDGLWLNSAILSLDYQSSVFKILTVESV